MKLLILAFGKPLAGLVAGSAFFYTVPVARQQALQAHERQLRAIEAEVERIEQVEDGALQLPAAPPKVKPHEHQHEANPQKKIQPDE